MNTHSRDRAFYSAGAKLVVFTLLSIFLTGGLAIIMGNIGLGGGHTYKAVFTNASMLEKGDDVRIAGVSVGEVKKVEHYERTMALVTFRIDDDVRQAVASGATG